MGAPQFVVGCKGANAGRWLVQEQLPWLLLPVAPTAVAAAAVAPAARGSCRRGSCCRGSCCPWLLLLGAAAQTRFLSFLPSDLLWALSTPASFWFHPLLPALLAHLLQPCPLSYLNTWCLSPWTGFMCVAFKPN